MNKNDKTQYEDLSNTDKARYKKEMIYYNQHYRQLYEQQLLDEDGNTDDEKSNIMMIPPPLPPPPPPPPPPLSPPPPLVAHHYLPTASCMAYLEHAKQRFPRCASTTTGNVAELEALWVRAAPRLSILITVKNLATY
jgi:hypothetical protein